MRVKGCGVKREAKTTPIPTFPLKGKESYPRRG
jgi:hypothetical protein